jgi:hypothetical protein
MASRSNHGSVWVRLSTINAELQFVEGERSMDANVECFAGPLELTW